MIDQSGPSDLSSLENDATKRTNPCRSAVLSPSMSRSTPSNPPLESKGAILPASRRPALEGCPETESMTELGSRRRPSAAPGRRAAWASVTSTASELLERVGKPSPLWAIEPPLPKRHRPVGERREVGEVRRETSDVPVGKEAHDLVGRKWPGKGARRQPRGGLALVGRQVDRHGRLGLGDGGLLAGMRSWAGVRRSSSTTRFPCQHRRQSRA